MMKKIWKTRCRMMLATAFMLLCKNYAFAQEWSGTLNPGSTYKIYTQTVNGNENGFRVECDNDANFNGKTYESIGRLYVTEGGSSFIQFNTTEPIMVTKMIDVQNGSLTLTFGSDATYDHPTLKRAIENTSLPLLRLRALYTDENGCALTLNGNASGNIVLDGGCIGMTIDSTNMHAIQFSNTGGVEASTSLIQCYGGSLNMDKVTMKNNWNTNQSGGAIYVSYTSERIRKVININNCIIEWCRVSDFGGAIDFNDGVLGSSCTMTNCTIRYCLTHDGGDGCGGAIRSMGSNLCTLSMTDCNLHHNFAQRDGGAIRWHSALIDPLELTRCTFVHNWSKNRGGAMRIESGVIFNNCTIKDNRAEGNGGAISYGTFTNGSQGHLDAAGVTNWFPPDGILSLDAQTVIQNNTTESYGGAISIEASFIHFSDNSATVYLNNLGEQFKMGFELNGASIANNSAGHGGAIHMMRDTDFYGLESNLNWGDVLDNRAANNGGFMFMTESINSNYAVPAGGLDYVHPVTGETHHLIAQEINTRIGAETATSNMLNVAKNIADANGGAVFLQNGNAFIYDNAIIGGTSANANHANHGHGGGIYVYGGNIIMNGGNISYNQCVRQNGYGGQGGGFYVSGGSVEVKGGTIANNVATLNGGGFFVSVADVSVETKINSSVSTTTISGNSASTGNGGGVYVSNGRVIIDNVTLSGNKAESGNGGGICINSSSATNEISIKNGTKINGTNKAKNGAGVYVAKGAVTIEGSTTQINGNQASANGGGLCSMGGFVTIKDNATINNNTAVSGGGIYASADIDFSSGTISNNTATNGGGLYVPQCTATLDFTSGTFDSNYASSQGGGIYISEGAVLNLQGVASLSGNHVPDAGKGGGIYMNGTLNVGGGTGTQSMRCNDNYAGTSYSLATQNNVYLPSRTKYITLKSDISHKTGGVYDTQIGITANGTVGDGGIPVVYVEDAANEPWLYALMADISTAGGAVFDDTQSYIAIHTRRTVGGFNKQFIYFSGCWTTVVTTNPGTSHIELQSDGYYHIKTNQGLAWFSSLVNGLNLGSAAPANTYSGPQPQLKAKLEADVDMGQYLWVPLGAITGYNSSSSTFTESLAQAYTGEFDGQGHIIKGINNGYLTGISYYGLFGGVGTNGIVKNTFLDDYTYLAVNSGTYLMGGISGRAGGNAVISNCEARGSMDLTEGTGNNNAGGIVGNMAGTAKVHSCMAMPDILANNTRVGGIAGFMNPNTSVKNCFANGSYTRGSTDNCFIGGLVGINYGIVENCYSRLQGIEPSNFGWFAGTNAGSVNICYAPTGKTNYVNSTSGTPTLTGHGNYAATALVNGKYGFAHQDQEVTATNTYVENGAIDNQGELKGLLATLNNWVEAQTDGVAYSTWTRTMASPINDDLPILEFDDFVSAGSTDNVFIAYKDDLNDMIDYANASSTGGSVFLYDATPTAVNRNTNANVRVYIDPNVGITQAAGNTLNARVGVALDNSSTDFMAYDWHMFSSALQAAPMGLVYHSEEGTYYVRDNYATLAAQGITHGDYTDPTKMDPPMTTWNTTPGQIGYFPTDAPYGSWRGTPDSRGSFDFYCYHEPSRHWINFKREGRAGFFDHWNQYVYNPATDKHTQIQYPNESAMVSGKGYMVALNQPSMMMADGVLNNTATQSSNASYNEGTGYDHPLRGINLVGNPYQSYLDFKQFATTNGIDTYYILDADAKGYIAYTTGATPQESDWPNGVKSYTADQYIHPHQGFFVRVDAAQPISFNSDMRKGGTNTSSVGSDYRDWEPRYALVNMVCTDGGGRNDFATIELDRPEQGGGRKAKGLRSGDASIWFRLGDEDYQIAFAPVGTASAPLRFEAHSDGVYTLRWNMQNADFSYLHLIDNLTGADIDCLSASEYVFEGKTTDYTSRFRLVFDFTGVEENDEPTEGPATFAFMMGDELIVNGEGELEMFDLNGRQLFSTEIHGTQASVALPKVAAGLYVLRLTDGNQVRTQKMVINK